MEARSGQWGLGQGEAISACGRAELAQGRLGEERPPVHPWVVIPKPGEGSEGVPECPLQG